MTDQLSDQDKKQLDATMIYLLSSARSYVDEPSHYIPIRLLEGVYGILTVLARQDENYQWLLDQVETAKGLPLNDEEAYLEMMDGILGEWAKRVVRGS